MRRLQQIAEDGKPTVRRRALDSLRINNIFVKNELGKII